MQRQSTMLQRDADARFAPSGQAASLPAFRTSSCRQMANRPQPVSRIPAKRTRNIWSSTWRAVFRRGLRFDAADELAPRWLAQRAAMLHSLEILVPT